MKDVEEREAAGLREAEFVEKYVKPRKPVLIHGINCWPRGGAPTLKTIADLPRSKLVEEQSVWSAEFFKRSLPPDWTPADYVRHLTENSLPVGEANERPYLSGLWLGKSATLGGFADEFEVPGFLPRNLLDSSLVRGLFRIVHRDLKGLELFVGGVGAPRRSNVHIDSLAVDVLTCCTEGNKQFFLFPPTTPPGVLHVLSEPCVYSGLYRYSMVELESSLTNPDPVQFPLFDTALKDYAQVARIRPGSMLYMPTGWWHGAHNLQPTVTVTWRMISNWSQFRTLLGEVMHLLAFHMRVTGPRAPSGHVWQSPTDVTPAA